MFNLITPKKRDESQKELNQMFKHLKTEYGALARDHCDHEEAQYLVYSHKKFGVIGGARLIPIDQQALTTDLLKRLKFEPRMKIWEISRIFFQLPEDISADEREKMHEIVCRDFYRNMYDSLKTISIAQKIKAFITVLPLERHQTVLNLGLWAFEKQGHIASPHKDNQKYVFGFMPMNEDTYTLFQNRRVACEELVRIC